MQQLAAFILAGGKSSRMGSDKAFLQLNGRTLLEDALSRARAVVDNIHLVGPGEKLQAFGPVVEDLYPDRGPLGGIHAALSASDAELNLMLAVDLPFVEARFLRLLIEQASACRATVTLPRIHGRWQPLCAVYRKAFQPIAEQALRRGQNKIDALFSQLTVRTIEEPELRDLAFEPAMFDNLNTPEDWERARARVAKS
jgi:molybdopterin-guanine dinucleotide biosynthesis protein A